MYAQVRHPWRTRPVRIIPKSRTCAAGSQLPAFHSPLFICHFRYNARRHAASTSMYAQVRHPWRTWPVRVIPKSRTCAAGSQHFAVLCLSATFDTALAGTQQVHPCMLRCAILGAQGLYALYRKADLRCWLPALRSPLFIWHFRYNDRRHAASTSMYAQVRHPWHTRPVRVIPKGELALLAPSSQLSALGSRLSALGSRLSALGSRLSAPSSELPALNFSNNNPSKT